MDGLLTTNDGFESLAKLTFWVPAFHFANNGKLAFGIVAHQVGRPAHICFIWILAKQHLAILPVGLCVLHFNIYELQRQLFGYLLIIKSHLVTDATVFRGKF